MKQPMTKHRQVQHHGNRAPRGSAQLTERIAFWCTAAQKRKFNRNKGSMWARRLIDEATS